LFAADAIAAANWKRMNNYSDYADNIGYAGRASDRSLPNRPRF